MMQTIPPLSLYVHLPWCVAKCPYCDFNSHVAPDHLPETTYVDALLADLECDLPRVEGRSIHSVFLGGGTPSLFSPKALGRLFEGFHRRLPIATAAEITMEANPGTLEHAPLTAYRDVGINRLSLGIQSFDDSALRRIGRVHGARDALRSLESAMLAGFTSINVDLMYGLPQQQPGQALRDVQEAIASGVSHISHYQLTIEPNTLFHVQRPQLPDDEAAWDMQRDCQQTLADAGLQQYEISAYAANGHRCEHNLNYWRFGDYLGIGAGAHGKLTDGPSGRVRRYWKTKHPRHYIEQTKAAQATEGQHDLTPAERRFEFVLNALRLNEGFPIALYIERTGLTWDDASEPWASLFDQQLLSCQQGCVMASATGHRYLNDVLERFLPDEPN